MSDCFKEMFWQQNIPGETRLKKVCILLQEIRFYEPRTNQPSYNF